MFLRRGKDPDSIFQLVSFLIKRKGGFWLYISYIYPLSEMQQDIQNERVRIKKGKAIEVKCNICFHVDMYRMFIAILLIIAKK